jgi:hypothetical protein
VGPRREAVVRGPVEPLPERAIQILEWGINCHRGGDTGGERESRLRIKLHQVEEIDSMSSRGEPKQFIKQLLFRERKC